MRFHPPAWWIAVRYRDQRLIKNAEEIISMQQQNAALRPRALSLLGSLVVTVAFTLPTFAQRAAASSAAAVAAPNRVTQGIDESQVVTLWRNTRPEAKNAAFDLGPVSDGYVADHILLVLQRSPEQEQALEALLEQLN